MTERGYRGPDDVAALQAFQASAIARAGHRGYLHVGDVPHRMFNGLRNEASLSGLMRIWESEGRIVAWALVEPKHLGFDAQVDPEVRIEQPELERDVLAWAEARTREELEERGSDATQMLAEVFDGDDRRRRHLMDMGWFAGPDVFVLTRRSLDTLPELSLPPGYSIRHVYGTEEAEAVAAVHAASFDSVWLPGQYRTVMESPGYDSERELLAVAPDGEPAGFTVLWYDERNRIGLFEPVGVHREHRRRGLGAALLAAGCAQMQAHGLAMATVMYEEDNPASGPLYRSMGFEPEWPIRDYRKDISPGS